jgi:hypothetical protein
MNRCVTLADSGRTGAPLLKRRLKKNTFAKKSGTDAEPDLFHSDWFAGTWRYQPGWASTVWVPTALQRGGHLVEVAAEVLALLRDQLHRGADRHGRRHFGVAAAAAHRHQQAHHWPPHPAQWGAPHFACRPAIALRSWRLVD